MSLFASRDDNDDIVTLNLYGTTMATHQSTLFIFSETHVLESQFSPGKKRNPWQYSFSLFISGCKSDTIEIQKKMLLLQEDLGLSLAPSVAPKTTHPNNAMRA